VCWINVQDPLVADGNAMGVLPQILVWPPINRTIVIEVDTNINFSADICIGKEQPTAINYTDGC
jgi:hypothetical protein